MITWKTNIKTTDHYKRKGIYYIFHVRDNEIVEIDIYPSDEEETILGNIYVGKVQNIIKNVNAAFVEIGGMSCYMSLAS